MSIIKVELQNLRQGIYGFINWRQNTVSMYIHYILSIPWDCLRPYRCLSLGVKTNHISKDSSLLTRIALSEFLPNPTSKFPTRTSILVFLDLNILAIDITSTYLIVLGLNMISFTDRNPRGGTSSVWEESQVGSSQLGSLRLGSTRLGGLNLPSPILNTLAWQQQAHSSLYISDAPHKLFTSTYISPTSYTLSQI